MKKQLILSDIWGFEKTEWHYRYIDLLKNHYSIELLDSQVLAGINATDLSEDELHNQFVKNGINIATEKLLTYAQSHAILAFSIGGYIAWKAIQKGFDTAQLLAVSSTRLRKENSKLDCKTTLFYGENDKYKPSDDWFDGMNLKQQLIKDEGHEFYKKSIYAELICKDLASI